MLKIKPPNYKFCPLCGTKLKLRTDIDKEIRKICPSCGWVYYPHVFESAIAVVYRDDEVLLVKRARSPYKNTWMFPAGFVDYGEHPKDTVIREVKEETGLNARKPDLVDVIQITDDPRAPGHFGFFYKVDVTGNIHVHDKYENGGINWFNINKLPKIGWKSHKLILKKLKEGKI